MGFNLPSPGGLAKTALTAVPNVGVAGYALPLIHMLLGGVSSKQNTQSSGTRRATGNPRSQYNPAAILGPPKPTAKSTKGRNAGSAGINLPPIPQLDNNINLPPMPSVDMSSINAMGLDPKIEAALQQSIAAQQAGLNPSYPKIGMSTIPKGMSPKQEAAAAAAAQYDAEISQLENQASKIGPQTAQDQKDIGNWFNQVQSSFNTGQKTSREDLANNMSSLSDATQAITSILGPNAGYGAAQTGQLALGGLASQGNANDQFTSQLNALIPMQGASAHLDEQRRMAQQANDLAQQIVGQKKEKGAYYGAQLGQDQQQQIANALSLAQLNQGAQSANASNALSAAQLRQSGQDNITSTLMNELQLQPNLESQKLQNQGQALQNAGLQYQNELLPYTTKADITKANLENQGLQYQNQLLPYETKANAAKANLQNQLSRSQLKAARSGSTSNTLANPAITAGMEKAIMSQLAGPHGGLSLNPLAAQNVAQSVLSRYGFSGPRAQNLVSSIMNQLLGVSHAHNQFKNAYVDARGHVHARTHIKK